MRTKIDSQLNRITITLSEDKARELRKMAIEGGIPVTQAAALCVNVGLKYLRLVVTPEVLLQFESYQKLLREEMKQDAVI